MEFWRAVTDGWVTVGGVKVVDREATPIKVTRSGEIVIGTGRGFHHSVGATGTSGWTSLNST